MFFVGTVIPLVADETEVYMSPDYRKWGKNRKSHFRSALRDYSWRFSAPIF